MHQTRKLFMLMKPASSFSNDFFSLLILLGFYLLCYLIVIKMTIKGGTKQACAACKYLRRKCALDCPLARYFPANQQKMFLNAHRLFGVSNIGRILKKVEDDKRDEAMRTIIFEANIRAKDRVHGCWGIICHLQHIIQSAMDEVRLVKAAVAKCREFNQYQVGSSGNVVNLGQNNDLYAESNENFMKQNDLRVEQDPFYEGAEDFPMTVPQDYDDNLPPPGLDDDNKEASSSEESKDAI